MSTRRRKYDSGIATWWLDQEANPFATIIERVRIEMGDEGTEPDDGVLTLTRDEHGDIRWTYVPTGWSPCDGDCARDCDTHVQCDDHCLALLDPQTIPEFRAALEHWRSHGVTSGCSHGC